MENATDLSDPNRGRSKNGIESINDEWMKKGKSGEKEQEPSASSGEGN